MVLSLWACLSSRSVVLRARASFWEHRLSPALPETPRASPPVVQVLVKVPLLWSNAAAAERASPGPAGVPELELQSVPGPLQGGISDIGHPHGFGSFLQPNCQLPPERGRPKRQVKPPS